MLARISGKGLISKIGAKGFEPSTSRSRTVRSTRLSYAPENKSAGRPILAFKWIENQFFTFVLLAELPVGLGQRAVRF